MPVAAPPRPAIGSQPYYREAEALADAARFNGVPDLQASRSWLRRPMTGPAAMAAEVCTAGVILRNTVARPRWLGTDHPPEPTEP